MVAESAGTIARAGMVWCIADDQAYGYRYGACQEVLIAILAAARPIEFAAIQLIRARYSKVTPGSAHCAGNQLPICNESHGAKNGDKKTRDSQQHSDNRSGIYYGVTGRSGTTVLGKFVNQPILRATRYYIVAGEVAR